MTPTQVVVSVPVESLDRALSFYREGFAVAASDPEDGVITIELANLSLFLIERGEFSKYSSQAGVQPRARDSSVECILSCALASKEDVDSVLDKAKAAGGSVPGPAKQKPWGYTGYVRDPDGHLWELVASPQA